MRLESARSLIAQLKAERLSDHIEIAGRLPAVAARVRAFSAVATARPRMPVALGIAAKEFEGQIEIEPIGRRPFSLGGDSGSLIFDSRRRAIGLLFAGNDVDATYANPIQRVLDSLNVGLVH